MFLMITACGALSLARGADAISATSSSTAVSISSPSPGTESDRPSTYTVEKGDTLASVAHQFHCTTGTLKKLNGLKHSHLKPGLVLDLPPSHSHHSTASTSTTKKHDKSSTEVTSAKTSKKSRHHSLTAQPVQDFDVPPSTFASCPAPAAGDNDESMPPTIVADQSQITSATPSGPTATPADFPPSLVTTNHRSSLLPIPSSVPSAPRTEEPTTPTTFSAHQKSAPNATARQTPSAVLAPASQQKNNFANAIANFFGGSHTSESGEWGNRFLDQTRTLAGRGVGYDEPWRPEGESHSWEMDCSNTTRYLYHVTAGIQLPRTASDQYYYLHLQDKAWDVPMTSHGFADCNFLRSNLKPGDLLFWENTYRPERQPPITHVMIFLGTDSHDRWLMAGSQSGHHGFYNPARTGPDVYVFDPTHYSGGYTTWLGLVHHHGRFVAYGRPLEADAKKLSVAAND